MPKRLTSAFLLAFTLFCLLAANICYAGQAEGAEDVEAGAGTPGSTSTESGEAAPGTGTSDQPGSLFERVTPKEGQVSKVNLIQNLPSGEWTDLMANVINLVLAITGSLAFASFTYGGVMMVTAQGNDEQIRKGKNILFWSILALAIIAASYAIVVGITQLRFFQ